MYSNLNFEKKIAKRFIKYFVLSLKIYQFQKSTLPFCLKDNLL
jgi:hypothetical protein